MKKTKKSIVEWRRLLADCKARPKGTSIDDWCHQQNISVNTFKYWQRKLRDRQMDEEVCFVPLELPVQQTSPKSSHSEVLIRYKDFEIVVTEQSSQSLLTSILTTVRESC